jgi:hypothetical protein
VTDVRLLTYNIKNGGIGREPFLIATIAECAPDIVLFQEAIRADVIERIAKATGMAQWATFRPQSIITSGIARAFRDTRFSRS